MKAGTRRFAELLALVSSPVVFMETIFSLCRLPCPDSISVFVKVPQVDASLANADLGLPAIFPFRKRDSLHAACVVRRRGPIPLVGLGGYVAKVAQAVICSVAIDVVDFLFRPFPVDVQPRQSMSAKRVVKYCNIHIARTVQATSRFPGVAGIPYAGGPVIREPSRVSVTPRKFTGISVVIKKFTHMVRSDNGARAGYVGRSHSRFLHNRIGQGRALFPQRFRPVFPSRFTSCSQGKAA